MILGGAVGNLIDRVFYGFLFDEAPLFYGKVVDFFDVDFFNVTIWGYHLSRWPVFNIADASVTLGVLVLLFTHRTAIVPDGLAAMKPGQHGPAGSTREPQTPPAGE
jgi:lipoprotein signal peptidase